MNLLKQSTAATIKLGPFIDDTDGKSAETGLTISQADIRLSKNGGGFAHTNNSAGATHDEFGYYDIPLDTTDTGTLGRLRVAVSESGALPVWQDFLVVTANVYDTLCSTDTFDVNVTALADDVITAGKFDESTAYPLKSADTGTTQVARVGAGSDTLETLSDQLDLAATASALSTLDGKVDTIDNFLDTEVAAILADTDEIQAELADGGRTDLLIDAIKAKTDLIPATPAQAGEYTAAIAAIPTAPLLAANYTAPDNTSIAAIKEKTDNLPASPAPANEYDTELTAIQTDLDNPDQYKADVSALATTAHVQEVEDKVDIVDGIADAILDDTGTSGVLLSTSALGSIFDDEVIVGTYTFSDLLKIMAAALAGKLSGGGSTTLKFEGVDGASDVIVTTVDANKNRTNVVITV